MLATTKELLFRSKKEGWPDYQPEKIVLEIDNIISRILDPEQSLPTKFALILYAPTGPIQEIAMSNHWHEAYMELSAEIDNLEYLFSEDKSNC